MTEQKPETVFIDDKEYNLTDLSEAQRYFVSLCFEARNRVGAAMRDVDLAKAAEKACQDELARLMKEEPPVEEAEVASEE